METTHINQMEVKGKNNKMEDIKDGNADEACHS